MKINNIPSSNVINQEDLIPTEGGEILEVYIPSENPNIMIIGELIGTKFYSHFLDIEKREFISPENRFNEYNGISYEQIKNGYRLVSTIEVDKETGIETITGQVIENENILYTHKSIRYPKEHWASLWDSFQEWLSDNAKGKEAWKSWLTQFKQSSHKEKIVLLRSKLKPIWKSRWEYGLEPIEQALSKQEVFDLKLVSGFNEALLFIVNQEADFFGIDPNIMFNNVLFEKT